MDVIVISPPSHDEQFSTTNQDDIVIIENLVEEGQTKDSKERDIWRALAYFKKRRDDFQSRKRQPVARNLSDLANVFINELNRLTATADYDIDLHHKTKHGSFEYRCHHENCAKSYITKSHLDKHFQKQHGDLNHIYPCDKCSMVFENNKKLSNHRRLHPRIKIPCSNCQNIFEDDLSMKQHKLKCLDTSTKECGNMIQKKLVITPKARTTDKDGLMNSSPDEERACHLCTPCKIYTNKWGLERHMKQTHHESSFKCIRCQNGFESRSQWHSHKFNCSNGNVMEIDD